MIVCVRCGVPMPWNGRVRCENYRDCEGRQYRAAVLADAALARNPPISGSSDE